MITYPSDAPLGPKARSVGGPLADGFYLFKGGSPMFVDQGILYVPASLLTAPDGPALSETVLAAVGDRPGDAGPGASGLHGPRRGPGLAETLPSAPTPGCGAPLGAETLTPDL